MRAVQHVFVVQVPELTGQIVQPFGIVPDPLRQHGKCRIGTRFQQDPVNAPADRLSVDVRTGMRLRQETLKDRHQRGEFQLRRNAVPLRETEGKITLDAPVRDDDPRPAEKIAFPDLGMDLVDQHVRQRVHARPAVDERFFEMPGLPVGQAKCVFRGNHRSDRIFFLSERKYNADHGNVKRFFASPTK